MLNYQRGCSETGESAPPESLVTELISRLALYKLAMGAMQTADDSEAVRDYASEIHHITDLLGLMDYLKDLIGSSDPPTDCGVDTLGCQYGCSQEQACLRRETQ